MWGHTCQMTIFLTISSLSNVSGCAAPSLNTQMERGEATQSVINHLARQKTIMSKSWRFKHETEEHVDWPLAFCILLQEKLLKWSGRRTKPETRKLWRNLWEKYPECVLGAAAGRAGRPVTKRSPVRLPSVARLLPLPERMGQIWRT